MFVPVLTMTTPVVPPLPTLPPLISPLLKMYPLIRKLNSPVSVYPSGATTTFLTVTVPALRVFVNVQTTFCPASMVKPESVRPLSEPLSVAPVQLAVVVKSSGSVPKRPLSAIV